MWGEETHFPPGDAVVASSTMGGAGGLLAGGVAHSAAHLLQNSFAGATCHRTVADLADEERPG